MNDASISEKRKNYAIEIAERKAEREINEFRRNAPKLLNSVSAAKYLGVSLRVLLDSLDELKIPYKTIGRTKVFSRDSLDEWVSS